jgi:hypothetical protein
VNWNPLKPRNKEVNVSKQGDNYYATVKVDGEQIMTIVQPPTTYNSQAGVAVGGQVSVYDAKGNLRVEKTKSISYDRPIVLFKEDNKAGIKILDSNSQELDEIKQAVQEKTRQNPEIGDKIKIDKIDKNNITSVQGNNQVIIKSPSSSSVMQVESEHIKVIYTPKITPSQKELLESLLMFMSKALFQERTKYRSNIMMFDQEDQKLKIFASYNMEGDIDKNIQIDSNAGVSGTALKSGDIVTVDLTLDEHYVYDPTRVWSKMKSIFSIPIYNEKALILGLLNIDTDKNIKQTKFRNENFRNYIRIASEIFGKILDKQPC